MQTVDFDAIVHNAQYFKRTTGRRLCAVLKNDAYGHGLVRTASALCGIADFLAVGSVDEALAVVPFCPNVLVLLPIAACEVAKAASRGIVLTLDSFHTLQQILSGLPQGLSVRVHVKIQTGMNRLGFNLEEIPHLASAIVACRDRLRVEGVFSHFWGETNASRNNQLAAFLQAQRQLQAALSTPLIAHIANTSAALFPQKYGLDMVRVGLGIYGYGAEGVTPAKTVTARILAVRRALALQTVGYGAAYTCPNDTNLAVISCGYANGLPRAADGAHTIIRGQTFPLVGKVCMAMCTANVGNAQIAVGDTATLLGPGLNNANSQVIVYELLCNLK